MTVYDTSKHKRADQMTGPFQNLDSRSVISNLLQKESHETFIAKVM